jgi:D-galactarolactone isomerase
MTERPVLQAPPGTCDCHMHIYDGRYKPAGTSPFPPPDAPIEAYREVQEALGLSRTVVVQPNAYGFDNACTEAAVRAFGRTARGIATVPPDVSEAELRRLNDAGFRGARCYMLPGGILSWEDVRAIAARIEPFDWHVQLQVDGRDLPQLRANIDDLPVTRVIDHNGKFMEPVSTDSPAFATLLDMLAGGHTWVKLSAPYETSKSGPPHYEDVSALAHALAAAHPDRCVWASNWPHPNVTPSPSTALMLDLMLEWVDDDEARRRILVDNPAKLYGF